MKLSKESFSEAFQYFTRSEAEDLRCTCRLFNGLAGQLRDVFGCRLRLSYLSVAKGTNAPVSVKVRSTTGREVAFEDDEVQAMARLKAAVRVTFVRNCEINATVLTERLCRLFAEACSETAICNMLFINRNILASFFDLAPSSGYIHEMESAALQNFLLSFNICGVLNLDGRFRPGDFTRDFLLRCKVSGIQTLRCNMMRGSIDLQGMHPEQAANIARELVEGVMSQGSYR
ncbi:hypothetical protein AAVH_11301 [Aphelenchoides avenae]|nr:hypothetical protein AAVH_11301 [Aphelenchus avenae]